MENPKKYLWKESKLSKADGQVAFEQYKLYVEMADRISERRDKANSLFLTLNSGVVTALGFLWDKHLTLNTKWYVLLPLVVSLGFCWFWFRLVKSYRQLNGVKYELVGEMEKKLPIRIWSTEWLVLGEGKDPEKYHPFSHIEQNLPKAFAVLYMISAVIYLVF
jgi:hypothetical protein